MRDGVTDFMTEHSRQSSFIPRDRQDACVNADLAAGQTKRVDLLAVEYDELPLRVGQWRDRGDAFADLLNQRIDRGILADRYFLLHLLETAQAKLHFLAGGYEVNLSAPRLRHGRATGQSDSDQAKQTQIGTTNSHAQIKSQCPRRDKRMLCSDCCERN